MTDDFFVLDRRKGRADAPAGGAKRGEGKSRRLTERTAAGVRPGWALIALDEKKTVGCWVINESKTGFALETREPARPCPISVGETYWVQVKPAMAKKSAWVAANLRHCRERGIGTGIYKLGMQTVTTPPPELGHTPRL